VQVNIAERPALHLKRALGGFGKTFKVYYSTALTFSPDTVTRAALGLTAETFLYRVLQGRRPRDKSSSDRFRDLLRGVQRKNRLLPRTRDRIAETFSIERDVIDIVLDEPEKLAPAGKSEWQIFHQQLSRMGEHDHFYAVIERLSELDAAAMEALRLRNAGDQQAAIDLLWPYVEATAIWRALNPPVISAVCLLLEHNLRTIAFIDQRISRAGRSEVLSLLMPGRSPMGHWLSSMRHTARHSNLREFSRRFAAKDIRRNKFWVNHALLRKWSSGTQLMPFAGMQCVLRAVRGRIDELSAGRRFGYARWLAFLCELLIAGTDGTPPSRAAAQAQIRRRYERLPAE
jgi:hypothetical protein